MPSNCARVIGVVREWARIPDETAISRADVLFDLWVRHGQGGIPFCDDAVNDFIRRLEEEFRKPPAVALRIKTTDFCPPESAALKTVGDVCDEVDQS